MAIRHIQYSFSTGEVSPRFVRGDVDRYATSLRRCSGWKLRPKGGAETREGTRFIGHPKNPTEPARVVLFEFNIEQTYQLIFGPGVVEVYLDDLPLLGPGATPVEMTVPYLAMELFELQFSQSADVLFVTHPNHPPATISRVAADAFEYGSQGFRPVPFVSLGFEPPAELNLSAVTGDNVAAGASAPVFLQGDVGRQLVVGTGRAIVTGFDGFSQVRIDIISPFTSTGPFAAGFWRLESSPVATITPSIVGPVGDVITLRLSRDQEANPTLVTNGSFTTGAGWTVLSDAALSAGIADGGTDTTLDDVGGNFITNGVQPNHIALNTSGVVTTRDTVVRVVSETSLILTSGGALWALGNSYAVRDTSLVTFTDNQANLTGGPNGRASIEQIISTIAGFEYRVLFRVEAAPLSMQVGRTTRTASVLSEATYPIGNEHSVVFEAPGTLVFLQFRNNQNATAVLDDVVVRQESLAGFRQEDVGRFISLRGGLVEITSVSNASLANGIIWAGLDSDTPVLPGAWVLGEPAWSTKNGYPRAISFHSGRLWFGGTRQQPLTLWGSVAGEFENFSLGPLDADAVDVEVSANQMNAVEWIEPFQDLFVGTRGGTHLITGGNNPITPANKAQVPQDTEGSAPIRPIRLGSRLFQLSRGRRQLLEFVIDADTGLSEPRDITQLSDHITESGVVEMALQTEPYRVLWAVKRNGDMIGYTMELSEDVRGWHAHPTQGQFQSIMVRPLDEGVGEVTEEVWVIAQRNGKRCIEVFTPQEVGLNRRKARLTLDSAVRYRGPATQVIGGLGHLEGLMVAAVGREEVIEDGITVDRLDNLGSFVVTGAEITLPEARSAVDVGLAFVPVLETMPPELELRDGTVLGRKTRVAAVDARVYETIGLTINAARASSDSVADPLDTGFVPKSGLFEGVGTDWEDENGIFVEQREPFPATLLYLVGHLDMEEAD